MTRTCPLSYAIKREQKQLSFPSIAYRNGWISEEKMRELAKPMQKYLYG